MRRSVLAGFVSAAGTAGGSAADEDIRPQTVVSWIAIIHEMPTGASVLVIHRDRSIAHHHRLCAPKEDVCATV